MNYLRIFALLIIVVVLLYSGIFLLNSNKTLQSAQDHYNDALKATTRAERTVAGNHALKEYLALEMKYHPKFGDGNLYYNIGNTFFALEQYPWALLYYYRAQSLNPTSDTNENIQKTLEKLHLSSSEHTSLFERYWPFHKLPLPQRIQIVFFLSLISFCLFSLFIWLNFNWVKMAGWLFSFLSCLFLLSIVGSYFFSPINAVVVSSSSVFSGPGTKFPLIETAPIQAGSKVEVLEITKTGDWAKIRMIDGRIGFLKNEKIKII